MDQTVAVVPCQTGYLSPAAQQDLQLIYDHRYMGNSFEIRVGTNLQAIERPINCVARCSAAGDKNSVRPDLIDVLDYYQGLTNRLAIMKQNRHVLVYLLEKIMLCRRIILLQICCFYYHYKF
jgi:hypothetical protein